MAKINAARNTAADLRTAYLIAFDNFSTDPIEVGNAVNGNSRYGRELLGTLVNANLVCTTLVNNADMVWQCFDTYDNVNRAQAEATIDAWLATWTEETPAPKAKANPANLPECRCGCGEPILNSARDYRPGHDARHAGLVARAIAAGGSADLLDALPSEALKTKARAHAARLGSAPTKADRKPKKAKLAEIVDGTVKIGRWEYRANRNSDTGEVFYMKKGANVATKATPKQATAFIAK